MKYSLHELLQFGLKQAYASLFGGFLLLLIMVSNYWYPLAMPRYDFLFIAALAFQMALLVFKLETLKEATVILIFHLVATAMEIFKTSDAIGSWQYPEHFNIGFGNYPLFAGFMYSAVGSYIARIWRIFHIRFDYYPKISWTYLLATLIYLNFFTHHYMFDLRWLLIAMTAVLFWKSHFYYKVNKKVHKMPVMMGFFLVSLFIWFAENIATYSRIWIYPSQVHEWHMVSASKLTAWFLLMIVSTILVSIVQKPQLIEQKVNINA